MLSFYFFHHFFLNINSCYQIALFASSTEYPPEPQATSRIFPPAFLRNFYKIQLIFSDGENIIIVFAYFSVKTHKTTVPFKISFQVPFSTFQHYLKFYLTCI